MPQDRGRNHPAPCFADSEMRQRPRAYTAKIDAMRDEDAIASALRAIDDVEAGRLNARDAFPVSKKPPSLIDLILKDLE